MKCRECGASETEGKLEPVYEYPWDASDTEGSISEFVGYRCSDRRACRARVRQFAQIRAALADPHCRGIGQGWGTQQ
jgi:hypothetical protein